MASRLMALDASRGLVVVTCRCGFRAAALTRQAAQTMCDRHRAQDHPRQATYVASKRRARASATRVTA
jgi:hypothetical protein